MATRIPLPGDFGTAFLRGGESGQNLFKTMMNPILAREGRRQQAEQFQQSQAAKERQFAEQMALRKVAQAQANSLNPLHKMMLEQQLVKLKNSNDPAWQLKQFQSLIGGIGEMQGGNKETDANEMPSYMPSMPSFSENQEPRENEVSNDDMVEQVPSLNEQAISPYQANNSKSPLNGLDMEAIKRGLIYKAAGLKAPALQKDNVLHGPARDASDLARLKKEVGENSEVYLNAKAQYDAQMDAKKDLRDLRARTKAGLKVGEKEFFDPSSGEPLGKEIPLTEKERASEEGNILFNELYPVVYKGASPFSGQGSIEKLENAARNYKTNPAARKLFDDYLLSEKALAATVVNEASTLKAGKTNTTYKQLKESLDAQDIPKLVKNLIKKYQIPDSASLKASMAYQKLLSDARKKATKSTPATRRLYYNPELQAQHEKENIEEEDFTKLSDEELNKILGSKND